ncbi:hypothetical protein [Pelistega europaea]|uniref:Uncharacterized protein n=1 Tax=Pelistega europaea TaxID=106147 RepID=A0A7Y4LB68_9BURK|nr:hypothetical protein [Pelistega europaea]NOL50304.1 hypothetical protein [Pelistega europaea]
MKKLLFLTCCCLCLQACQHYLDPNASVDGVVGTVGGAFGNIQMKSPTGH